MKKLLLSFVMMLVALITNAQLNQIQNNNIEPCGFDQIHNELLNSDPSYRLKTEQFNDFAKNFSISTMKSGSVLRVPVVVHVMHKGEAVGSGSNISEADINQGILQLNERFRKIPGSLGDGNGVDVEIEFALAIRDPNGNCTNGIVRYNMSGQSAYMNYGVNRDNTNGIADGDLKALSRWNTNQYYNIYLVSEIDDNECGYGIQGYAYFASAHGQSYDGMVQLGCKFAQSGNTTLTHELGHALNLYHTFEGDANGTSCPSNTSCSTQGDRVCDIPPHIRSASDCVAGTNSCDGGSSKELFIHNYMDYSSDACQSEFTAGQKTRAVAALTSNRASYLEINGNMSLVPPASAGVDFSASNQVVCLGSPVSFYDESTCIPNTYQNGGWSGISFSWTFDNGVDAPVTSTLQNPTITFANAGSYTVTLQVTNGHGTTSLTKPNFVVVASGNPTAACIPTSQNPSGNYGYAMSNFTFNTINNTTSSVANGEYVDYTCQYATNVVAGNAYDIKVTLNNQATYSEDVKVYIDYNDNGVFAAGELVMSATRPAGTGSSTFTQNITIPLTAVTGKVLRVRAIADANGVTGSCDNNFVGDVEDYGVYISSSACTPPAVTSHPVNRTICQSTNTTFVVAATDAVSYQWQVNTGSGFNNISNGGVYSGATLATLTITGATVGMNGNTYRCIVTGACEPTATSNSASLTVNATNTASVASSTPSLCINTLMTNITHATTGATGIGSPTNLPTGVSAGFASNTITISGTPNVAGTYNYSIPLTGGCGTVNATGTITVNPIPSNAGSIAGSVSECDNATGVAYSISSVSGATGYTWTVPSGATIASGQGTTNITVDFGTTSGNVAVTPTNSCGNGGQATKAVTIAPCGSAPVANFSVDATTICLGESVDFTDLSSNSPTSWLWNFGDGGMSASQNTTYTYNTPGTYTVTLTATNASGSDDEVKTNLIVVSPLPSVITSSTNETCLKNDGTATASGGGTYFWNTVPVQNTPTATGLSAGNYIVTVTLNGCAAQQSVQVSADNCVPNTQIRPEFCGMTLLNITDEIRAFGVPGADEYEFRITELATGAILTYNYGVYKLKLAWFTGIKYNTTYSVDVRARVGSEWGVFSNTCNITTPTMPSPNITSPVCGTTISSLTDLIFVKPVTKASNYEYKLTEKGTSNVYFYNNTIYRVQLSWFGPAIKYNTIYELEVRAYVNGDWGNYSPICEVTTPIIPSPNVTSSQCGTIISSLTELIFISTVKNATNYEYSLTEQGTANNYVYTNSIYRVQLSWFGVSNIKPNTVYELQTRAYVNGSWGDFGSICTITTPSAAMIQNETARFIGEEVVEEEKLPTTLSIYPNPNSGEQLNVMMDNLTPNTTLIITDIYGKVILNKPLNTELSQYNVEVKFENKLTSGFYFITIVSEENKVTEKLIVR
ncbi:MAG: PKD domain-containing protein [Flavobacteriales bacterium]|nr:PKD domain-containing protein [Flavobacteriales bacterium]